METWTVKRIETFYDQLNKALDLHVHPTILVGEPHAFPLYMQNGDLLFIPDFFNDAALSDDTRQMLLVVLYCCCYLDKNKSGHLNSSPFSMAKGICDELGLPYVSDNEVEYQLRPVRRKLYRDVENGCYFHVGDQLRESIVDRYQVTAVRRTTDHETLVTVKRIGCEGEQSEMTLSEDELYDRCCRCATPL